MIAALLVPLISSHLEAGQDQMKGGSAVPLHHAEDSHQAYEWEGTLVAAVSTHRPGRARWLEMKLYRLDSGGYLLHRLGYSVVYHEADGPCAHKGEPVTVERLPDAATRCANAPLPRAPRCEPPWPDDLADDEAVVLEQVRHTIDQGHDPGSIVARASTAHHRKDAVTSRGIPEPVKEMIRIAASSDEGFAAFAAQPKHVERIG
jgi:hypothetical protein